MPNSELKTVCNKKALGKMLFIAPLPPPINGQSHASQVFLDGMQKNRDIAIVDMVKVRASNNLSGLLYRCWEIGRLLLGAVYKSLNAEVIYITISESIFGNIKDILLYIICAGKWSRTVVHLHGGAGMAEIMKRRGLLAWANKMFLRRFKAVVVLGETHTKMYRNIVPPERLKIVKNFANDDCFITEKNLATKHSENQPLHIIYLSNLIPEKGYEDLLQAYVELNETAKDQVFLDFAGAIPDSSKRSEFLTKISELSGVCYHGVVSGEKKRRLLERAQVFCLPTYYPYEGQPISILEAYASGCAVITTNHSGIRDIFINDINGYYVRPRNSKEIGSCILACSRKRKQIREIGEQNWREASEKYRSARYISELEAVVNIQI